MEEFLSIATNRTLLIKNILIKVETFLDFRTQIYPFILPRLRNS